MLIEWEPRQGQEFPTGVVCLGWLRKPRPDRSPGSPSSAGALCELLNMRLQFTIINLLFIVCSRRIVEPSCRLRPSRGTRRADCDANAHAIGIETNDPCAAIDLGVALLGKNAPDAHSLMDFVFRRELC